VRRSNIAVHVGFEVLGAVAVIVRLKVTDVTKHNVLSPSSGARNKPNDCLLPACCLCLAISMLGLICDSEDGGSKFLRNVLSLLSHYSHHNSHYNKPSLIRSNCGGKWWSISSDNPD
jgi:hypothetical protein